VEREEECDGSGRWSRRRQSQIKVENSRDHEWGAENFSDSESVRETTVLDIVVIVTVGTLVFLQKNTGVGL